MAARKKMLAPNETIWWVDKAAGVTAATMTVAILNGSYSKNISCAIVAGYNLNSTDPQTDNTRSICDEGTVQNPIAEQYEGNLTFFRDANLNDAGSVFNVAFGLFSKPDAEGWLVRRVGKLSNELAASTDEIQAFGFTSDLPQSIDSTDGGAPIQMTVPFIPTGDVSGLYTL